MSTPALPTFDYDNDAAWTTLLEALPADLDAMAFQHLALIRRRKLRNAADLLRVLLAYATGLSMPMVAAWATLRGLATLTPEAVQDRLSHARHWLAALVLHVLTDTRTAQTVATTLRRLVLVDGTHAARPGAQSQDWRVHLCYDLQHGTLHDARVAAQHPGESFAHVTLQAGDLVVGDRNYGTRANCWRAIQAQADVLVRFVVRSLPLVTRQGSPFATADHLATLAPGATAEWAVYTKPTAALPAIRGRVVAYRLTPTEATRAIKAQRRHRQKSGRHRTAAPSTLVGWQYVVLFTTREADQLAADTAIQLYRCRWQLECAIKRYKSLCGLGELPTRTDANCQALLWAKLLLILLLERHADTAGLFSPAA